MPQKYWRNVPEAQLVMAGSMATDDPEGFHVWEQVEAVRDGDREIHLLSNIQQVGAVQINAFNFPVWGPLEKFAPAFIAGVPSLVKPATPTAYLTARLVELISGVRRQSGENSATANARYHRIRRLR